MREEEEHPGLEAGRGRAAEWGCSVNDGTAGVISSVAYQLLLKIILMQDDLFGGLGTNSKIKKKIKKR